MLKIDSLSITIDKKKPLFPVRDVSLTIESNEITAIIGESGCGKSLTARSILQLDTDDDFCYGGTIHFKNQSILNMSDDKLNSIRGRSISYISQDPMDALNPSLRIGYQILEGYRIHFPITKKEGRKKILKLLRDVGIHDPERVYKSYPHQLSGGMRQRVCIAMAVVCQPDLVIADEPTTALDSMTEKKILVLLKTLQENYGMSILLISHDIKVVRSFADKVIVMYAGEVVESVDLNRGSFRHPYSCDLLKCLPKPSDKYKDLYAIEGHVYDIASDGQQCLYADRCSSKMTGCTEKRPTLKQVEDKHGIRCLNYEK